MRSLLLRAGSVVLVCGALLGIGVQRRPNIVLIVIDTLRADHLGCYGYERATSPRLDALAATGVRFTNAHSASSWTAASVASILTGLYPAVHGVDKSDAPLSADIATMPATLRAAGYATAAFSANPAYVTPEMGFARGFDEFEVLHGPRASPTSLDIIPDDPALRTFVEVANASRVSDVAVGWLARRGGRAPPFFLYVHYLDPHAGYYPPPEYAALFGVPPDAPLAGEGQRPVLRSFKAPGGADLATLVALYDGEIAFTDSQVGRLLDGLTAFARGPTVVIVTADHGEEFGDHGGLLHGITLWEEQLHVPLIVAGSGIAHRVLVEPPVSLVALWPTIADLAGVHTGPGLPATSMAPTLKEGAVPARGVLFADLELPHPGLPPTLHRRAVLDGSWKLLVSPEQLRSLFDLAKDPGERNDVLGNEVSRAAILKAQLQMRDAAAIAARERVTHPTLEITEEQRARLKALGYAQ